MSVTSPSPVAQLTRSASILTIVSAAIALLFGILVLVFPKTSLLVIGILFGLQLIITGIIRLVTGISDKSLEGWEKGLTITLGVLVVVAGIFCLRNPALSILTLLVVLAVGWLIDGVMNIVIGVQNPKGERVWKIVMGVVYLLGAIVLLASPVTSVLVLALLGGWILIVFGVVTLIAGIMGLRASKTIA
ncbi:MAG TPA: DUF308 domain-containing protein [Microlunatus sp.]|nr:DUF308 domain-containing protein [Microlunatus sp.]